MQTLPTGTVSFLFTDIEGSTSLLQRLGDRGYREVLDAHDRLLQSAFAAHGGQTVETQGDAFFVAFRSARDAVDAAIVAQRAILQQAWPADGPVRVRMGLHTGEPLSGSKGLVGLGVHRAARICAAGHGGQILLSQIVADLIEPDLPPGVTLRDLGEHRLKDLARPEHIYQIVIPGLPADFSPLKSLDLKTNNLPSLELTSFVGRQRELVEIKRLLSGSRLVTLMGPGGAGKTRLSLQVGADLIEKFPHGVWLVELAPLSDPSLVVQTVATVFGVREMAGRLLLDSLIDYLRARELLLVLDNCEHLVAASAHLASALLRGCPKLRILASSREALGTAGEVTYRVPSLSVPDPQRVTSVDQLTQFDATRLFLERAAISNPRYVVTDAQASVVAQISRRLDGIPLAIELAAARIKVLPVEQIARRLDDRFRLLTGGSRTGLMHHQTLRAAVDWSYDLLAEDERVLFRRLSVFAGGFALEAAEAVCAGDGLAAEDVLDLLARLVDKSLAVAEAMANDIRYRMLETIRVYSRGRLVESGEAASVQQRHLDWYLGVAEQAESAVQGPDQLTWLDRLELDFDDFRAALQRAKADGASVEAGARLAGALHRFWALRGYLREGRGWLEDAAALNEVSAAVRARAAYGAGLLAFHQGNYERAEALSAGSLKSYRELNDPLGTALSLNTLGIVARNRGDYRRARTLLDESLTLSRQAGHAWALAEALNILGVVARRQGDRAQATAMFDESLALWRQLGDRWGLAATLGHLGVVARHQGDYERAKTLHEESLGLRRQLGDRRSVAADLSSLGVVARHLGNYEQARVLLEESLALSRELGDKLSIAATLCTLGLVAYHQDDNDRAAVLLQESLTLSGELGDKMNRAAALCNLGFVAMQQGDYERAAALHDESLSLYFDLGSDPGIYECLVGRARVAAAQGQAELAAGLLGAAEALREAKGVSLPPSDKEDYDRALADVRALLSEHAFAAAWAQGQATSLKDVIRQTMG